MAIDTVLLNDSIDDVIFHPLSNFLIDGHISPRHLKRGISENGIQDYFKIKSDHQLGCETIIMQAYLNFTLKEYSKSVPSFFKPEFREFTINGEIQVKSDKLGGVYFNGKDGKKIVRLDAIWEYKIGRQSIPIIFATSTGKVSGVEKKRGIVAEIYESDSYFCKVRPVKEGEDPGLYNMAEGGYYRKILVPPIDFTSIAKRLGMAEVNANRAN